ncbi:hypothetical protein [Kitasatospora viridis]|uniref:Uncharacterized protein n=1 Tax=Kitasatospora viridis TaxID=281105 RepID=A0A561UF39_9ACTN|nr:hypothetical protein [Kitasatospora viridis]TWF97997.1 hypothetical protein FHX73_111799 [Kitasatospora viridis]
MAINSSHTSPGARSRRATAVGLALGALTAGLLAGVAPAQAAPPAKPASAPAALPGKSGAPTSGARGGAAGPVVNQASPKPAAAPSALQQAESAALAKAKKTNSPVTVDQLTNETSETVINPDGTLTLRQHAAPVRVRKGASWTPIDTTLAKRADGRIAPGATDSDLSFSPGGNGPLITMIRDGKRLSISWPGTLPAPAVSGDTATYPAVLPDVDLAVTARGDGFSEVLVVKSAAAAANPQLATIHLGTTTDGLTLSQDNTGDALATDSGGHTVFAASPPMLWDSASAPTAPVTPAAHANAQTDAQAPATAAAPTPSSVHGPGDTAHATRLGFKVAQDQLSLTPDKGLLSSPATVYPVYIDPAWSGNPSLVSWLTLSNGGQKDTSGNVARVGFVGNWDGCAYVCNQTFRSYFQMNSSGFGGANVQSAYFYPYFSGVSQNDQPTDVRLDPLFDGNTNWSNKPTSSSVVASCTCNPGNTGASNVLNVIGAAQSAAANNWGSVDFEVDAHDETTKYQYKKIDPTQTYWTVTYYYAPDNPQVVGTTPQVNGPGGTFVPSSNVTMQISGGDRDGELVKAGFEIYHASNGSVTSVYQSGIWQGDYTSSSSPVTATGLPDGQYAWHGLLQSQQGNMQSPFTGWVFFTVSTAMPGTPDIESNQFPKNQFGGAYQDNGTFSLTTGNGPNDWGYIFSLDGDLTSTQWNQSAPPPTWSGGAPTRAQQYLVQSTGAATAITFPVGTVGPHTLYAKTISPAGIVSNEYAFGFWAGLTTPRFVSGDTLVSGVAAATNDDNTTTPVPAATSHTTGQLFAQGPVGWFSWYGAGQAMLANGTNPVSNGDSATFSFDLPHAGYWDLGANLTKAGDYGQYSLTLDQGGAKPATLITGFDAYNPAAPVVTTQFVDFGSPLSQTTQQPIPLTQGVHTLTLTITGKNAASAGYQAGIDVLRLAPMSATCTIVDLTACQNNTAISADNNHLAADADGVGASLSAGQLAAAGWTPNAPITVNGAPMTVPNYSVGKADNILSSGQTVTVGGTAAANAGNAVEFLAFATGGNVTSAYNSSVTGTITYPTDSTGHSVCGTTTSYPYSLDMVPDWVKGDPGTHAVGFANRNLSNGTDSYGPQLFPISVALPCPGVAIQSITLPVVTNRLVYGTNALHIMGVGIRPASYVPGSSLLQNWTGTWGAKQDTHGKALGTTTERTAVSITLPGANLRLRLSNALGSQPITLNHVTVAHQQSGAVPTTTPVGVTFNNGSQTVTIPAGGDVTSDGLGFPTTSNETLLISYQLASGTTDAAFHSAAKNATWYSSAPGDQTADTTGTPFTTSDDNAYWLSGIDVSPTSGNTGALVLYGDQTVNSDTTTPNGHYQLSDLIYGDVVKANASDPISYPLYAVVNNGQNGWITSNNLLPTLSGSANQYAPGSATDPIDRSSLAVANVHSVLISTGTSDLLSGSNATDLENKLGALAQSVRIRYSDANGGSRKVGVFVATIPANPAITGTAETTRQTVNNYILCGSSTPTAGACTSNANWLGGKADGAINFAAAVATDHTDTGPLNLTRDYYTDSTGKQYPSQLYFQDLADQYQKDSTNANNPGGGGVGVSPMTARRAQ